MQKFDKDKIFRTTTRALFFAAVAVLFGGALLSDYGGDGYLHPACLWTAVGLFVLWSVFGVVRSVFRFSDIKMSVKEENARAERENADLRQGEEARKAEINATDRNHELTEKRALGAWMRASEDVPRFASKSKAAWVNLACVVLFLAFIVGFIVLAACGLVLYALICLGAGFVIIFVLFAVHVIHKRLSSASWNIDRSRREKATVLACMISDESSYSYGVGYNGKTTRILGTTYLVYLDLNGEIKRAYVRKYYNKGETVYEFRNKKLKDMVVADE